MMPDTPTGGGSSAGVIQAIDRAVWMARSGRLLAACGGWLVAAATVITALAAVDVASNGRIGITSLPAAAKIAIVLAVAAAPAAVLCRRRIVREGWPSRLDIALATEQRHARLGESLSRAVGFLGDARAASAGRRTADHDTPTRGETGQGLRQLAIDQAAAAARDVGGFTVPGITRDAGWTAAGVTAALAVWISTALLPSFWRDAVRRQVTTASRSVIVPVSVSGQGAPAEASAADTPLPPAATASAVRLAAAAAVERRLTQLLATLFVQAPGVSAESLARGARRELDELAAVQTQCLQAVDAARQDLVAAARSIADSCEAAAPRHRGQVHQALAQLEAIDHAAAKAISADISANRLHSACDAAATLADTLAAVAASLGASPDDVPGQGVGGALGAAGSLLTAAATIDRIAGRHAGNQSATTAAGELASTGSGSGSGSGIAAGGRPEAAAGGRADGDERMTVPTAPGGRGATAGLPSEVAADASPVERVWSLLPAAERAHAARRAVESAPAEYRAAIDAYYRALLQSMPDRGSTHPGAASPMPSR